MPHYDEDEIAEYYDDLQASGGGGTILRPLHGTARRDPTVRWGDTLALRFDQANLKAVSGQFMRISLPTPRVCSLAFHLDVVAEPSVKNGQVVTPAVMFTTLDIFIALGASEYKRRVGFSRGPQVDAPIDYVLPNIPLQNVYVNASAQALVGTSTLPDACTIRITGQLAPVQSVPGQT